MKGKRKTKPWLTQLAEDVLKTHGTSAQRKAYRESGVIEAMQRRADEHVVALLKGLPEEGETL